jgi:protein-disulfide isomerase
MARFSWVSSAANAVLTVCAIVVTGLVVRREFFPPAPASSTPSTQISAWRSFGEGERMGPPDAPVRLVLFSDFQCPACRLLAEHLRTIRAENRDVEVIYRHAPLEQHAHAVPAARASGCAAAQGRFEQYHDALFAAQDSIGTTGWDAFARRAGVPDLPSFARCMSAPGDAALARDTLAARRLKVTGTPTYLLNDRRYVGAPPLDSLRAQVERARRSAAARSR